jgi:SAM-dependent methyltransferase
MPATFPRTSGLTREDFRCIGLRGVTSPFNSYSHSISWFRGRVYIGCLRNSLGLLKREGKSIPPPQMEFWPVYCPVPEDPESFRAEIIAYDPVAQQWELVHRSCMVEENGRMVPRDLAYRGMGVFQGKSDPHPCLYAGPISRHGCRLLRSEDGSSFHDAGEALDAVSVRTLIPFRGKLYTSPIGKLGEHPNESYLTALMATDDPVAGRWEEVSGPGIGDPSNNALFDVEEFQGRLYVSTMNSTSGFQVWRSDAEGQPPYRWRRVMTAGGYRGFLNEFGLKLCAFGEALYVGSGIAGGGYDRVHKLGPAAAELLRIWPDDTWDLVTGSPRLTPDGMKVPTSGMGPGFDNFLNGYMWYLVVHEGWLYVGTFNGAAFYPFGPHNLMTRESQEALADFVHASPVGTIDEFRRRWGGCQLWRTQDGERWYPIVRDGFGNAFNMGIRRMVSTPHGLFVGTSNPFGPKVGVKREAGWTYEENPRGGIEVWLGARRSAADGAALPGMARHEEVGGWARRSRAVQRIHARMKLRRTFQMSLWRRLGGPCFEGTECNRIGDWGRGAATLAEACEALVGELVGMMSSCAGPVLDVGCGPGDTTAILRRLLPAIEVLGVDELQDCVDRASVRYGDIAFYPMDPTRLEFDDNTFAHVVSVEEPAGFDSRQDFLREACRVLVPGGSLVMADVLLSRDVVLARRGLLRRNYVRDLAAYRRGLERAGFTAELSIRDRTDQALRPFVAYGLGILKYQFQQRKILEKDFNQALRYVSELILFGRHYLLVSAKKPT